MTAAPTSSATHGHGSAAPAPLGGIASKRIIVGYGFWIFLLSDIILFSGFFAAHAVLLGATAGGPDGRALFNLTNVGIETACLLASSFACGVAGIGVERRNQSLTQSALIVTGLLGVAFLSLELREFAEMVAKGAGPGRSAFLSSFFGLVGCHGLHIGLGLIWLGTMMAQFLAKGFSEATRYRFLCFSLFWHALDIVWVAIFTLVYLIGAGS